MSHDFKLDMEIYYSVSSDNAANRASGLKRPLRRTPSGHEVPKFILAGYTQLTVDHLHEDIKSHDLKTGKMVKGCLLWNYCFELISSCTYHICAWRHMPKPNLNISQSIYTASICQHSSYNLFQNNY